MQKFVTSLFLLLLLFGCKQRQQQTAELQALGAWHSPFNHKNSGVIVFMGQDKKIYGRLNMTILSDNGINEPSMENKLGEQDLEGNGLPKALMTYDTMVSPYKAFVDTFFVNLLNRLHREITEFETKDPGFAKVALGYENRVRAIATSKAVPLKLMPPAYSGNLQATPVTDADAPEFFAYLNNFEKVIEDQSTYALDPEVTKSISPKQLFVMALVDTIFMTGIPYPVMAAYHNLRPGFYLFIDSVENTTAEELPAYLDVKGHVANPGYQVDVKGRNLGKMKPGLNSVKNLTPTYVPNNGKVDCRTSAPIYLKVDNSKFDLFGLAVYHKSSALWSGSRRDYSTATSHNQKYEKLKLNLVYFCKP